MGCLLFVGLLWTAMQLLRKLASPTYAIAEVNIWFPVLPSTPGHRLGVFGALGRRFWLVFLLTMVNFPVGFQAYKCVCHLGLYLQSLHRNLEKLLRTQCLSALFLIQIMHKYCGIVTSSCYVNTSSNLTGLQRIQMQSCHNQTTVSWQAWVLLCHSFSVSFPIIFSSQYVAVSLTISFFSVRIHLWASSLILPSEFPHCFVFISPSPVFFCICQKVVRAHKDHTWSLPDQIKAHCLLLVPFSPHTIRFLTPVNGEFSWCS